MSQVATVDKEIPNPKKGGALATQEDAQKFEQLLANRGITQQQYQVLANVIHPNAESPNSVLMAFDYCRARKLDPFKRGVHIVPVWSKKAGKMVDTIWAGISEIRTTAMRSGEWAGCDEAVFGPEFEHEFVNGNNKIKLVIPSWCQFTVYRFINGEKCAFPGPKVRWLEEYATEKRDSDIPNDMWRTRVFGQIEKCAEAAALRRAFPEETEETAEEMEGQTLMDATPVSKKEEQEMIKQVAQEIANAAVAQPTQEDSDIVEAEPVDSVAEQAKPEPTSQEKRAAAARVAEATGQPQSTVDALNTGNTGITNKQSIELSRFGTEHGWTIADILALVTAEPYSINATTWNKDMTERQLLQVREHIKAHSKKA